MNAKELAALLEVDSWYKLVTREEIATMLRQQQAEIEALKSRKLTDEEIREFITVFPMIFNHMDLMTFARAILRKAQE